MSIEGMSPEATGEAAQTPPVIRARYVGGRLLLYWMGLYVLIAGILLSNTETSPGPGLLIRALIPVAVFLVLKFHVLREQILITEEFIGQKRFLQFRQVRWEEVAGFRVKHGGRVKGVVVPSRLILWDGRGNRVVLNSGYDGFEDIEQAVSFHLRERAGMEYEREKEKPAWKSWIGALNLEDWFDTILGLVALFFAVLYLAGSIKAAAGS
ncbi:MAG: hypothetical protein KKB20_17245 [Proteobacteria bacterium]|nr:hypothetical protein [Pseudomonadota bacterium]